MNDIVKKPAAALPAHLQNVIGEEAFNEFSGGVTSGFPIISYRGRTWRVRKGGEEQVYLNDQDEAIQSIEVVMIKSNPMPSKVFYEDKYTEGDSGAPRCWSANGVKPDAGVINPISSVCQSCPNNVWGSKITESGTKTRACSDVRRVAVAFMHQLESHARGEIKLGDIDVLLLRIPPASLNPLKDYVEKVLKPKGIPPYVLITRVGFDTEVAYPKLTFKGTRFLSEDEANASVALRESEDTRRILNEALENVGEETTSGQGEAAKANAQATAETASRASSPAPLQPVEEELFSEAVDDIAPAPEPVRAASVETDAVATEEAVIDEIAPPPPAEKAASKKKTAKKAAEKPSPSNPAEPSTTPPGGDDFDAMLSAILD